MEKTKTNAQKAEESLKQTLQEEENPSVKNLVLALDQANNRIRQMQAQMAQMTNEYRDMQLRLATAEFQHRLEFLWKVLFTDDSHFVFGDEFVEKCAEEFKEMMFPAFPVEQKEDEK